MAQAKGELQINQINQLKHQFKFDTAATTTRWILRIGHIRLFSFPMAKDFVFSPKKPIILFFRFIRNFCPLGSTFETHRMICQSPSHLQTSLSSLDHLHTHAQYFTVSRFPSLSLSLSLVPFCPHIHEHNHQTHTLTHTHTHNISLSFFLFAILFLALIQKQYPGHTHTPSPIQSQLCGHIPTHTHAHTMFARTHACTHNSHTHKHIFRNKAFLSLTLY